MRAGQHHLGDMLNGYCMDHDGESGKLYTLFSAPDYPQVEVPFSKILFILNAPVSNISYLLIKKVTFHGIW